MLYRNYCCINSSCSVDDIARTPATGARFSATDRYQLLDIFEYHIDVCTYFEVFIYSAIGMLNFASLRTV